MTKTATPALSARSVPAALLASVAAALLLVGCAAPQTAPDESGAGTDPGTAQTSAPDAGGSDVCGALEAAGATGASVGAFDITAGKDDLIAQAQSQLLILAAVPVPEAYYEEWNAQMQYAIEFQQAANELPDGGSFGAAAMPPADPGVSGFWSDFWFATCG